MKKVNVSSFFVTGITVRTCNSDGRAMVDIPQLWGRFMSEGLMEQIPDQVGTGIHAIYCDYEGDHNLPYTTFLGCQVSSLDNVPQGMTGREFGGGAFSMVTAKGNMEDKIVFKAWKKIWKSDLDRKYDYDFEFYGEKAENPQDAEVEIYLSLKS